MVVELFLSVVAGAATAAAATRIGSLRNRHVPSIGANPRIRGELRSLDFQRRILEKSIARLHTDSVGLSEQQRDRLLARYQNQLGAVAAHYEKLQEAAQHPDLGTLGDGLVTLMDQKLSGLEEKFGELSARIAAEQARPRREPKPKAAKDGEEKLQTAPVAETKREPPLAVPSTGRRIEITTLTEIPPRSSAPKPLPPIAAAAGTLAGYASGAAASEPPTPQPPKYEPPVAQPAPPAPPQRIPEPATVPGPAPEPPVTPAPKPVEVPPPRAEPPSIPDADPADQDVLGDDDGDDITELKKQILTSLKRLEQAEVE